jgi:hypothetical protein
MDIERQARQAVASAEKRRDEISKLIYHFRTWLSIADSIIVSERYSGRSTIPEPADIRYAAYDFLSYH